MSIISDFLAGFAADSVKLAAIVFLAFCLVSLEAERSRLKRARWRAHWDPEKQIKAKVVSFEEFLEQEKKKDV